MLSRVALAVTLLAVAALAIIPVWAPVPAHATTPSVSSSVSAYLMCPSGILLAAPGTVGSCGSGNYTGVYRGIGETVVSNQTTIFYLSAATGGVKVTFSLTDVTTGNLLLTGVGYGSISDGTCSSPSMVVPTSTKATGNMINSGDTLRISLNTTFTGTGTPTFCSGGTSATLISVGTSVAVGTSPPALTTLLTTGTPYQTTISGFSGIAVTFVDTGSAGFTAVVMGTVTNASGSTIDVLVASVTVAPGVSAIAFLKLNQYPSGTYAITVFAVTSSNVPISIPQIATVTV